MSSLKDGQRSSQKKPRSGLGREWRQNKESMALLKEKLRVIQMHKGQRRSELNIYVPLELLLFRPLTLMREISG